HASRLPPARHDRTRSTSTIQSKQLVLLRPRVIIKLPPFPTRRSSDLRKTANGSWEPRTRQTGKWRDKRYGDSNQTGACEQKFRKDRKSTRLNSSHVSISYAVFCLQEKTADRCTRDQ